MVLEITWHGIGDYFLALFMTAESFLMAPESSPSHRYYIWNQVTLKAHWMECFFMISNGFPVSITSAAALIYYWIRSYWDHLWTPAMEVKFHQEGLWNLRSNSDDVTGGHWALSDQSQCLSTETICTSKSHPEDAIPSPPPVNYKTQQRWVLMRIRRKDQVPTLVEMKAVVAVLHNSKGVLKNSRHIHFTVTQFYSVPIS